MTQIFGPRWVAQQGDVKTGERYSNNFLLWCEKTAPLAPEHWKWGLQALERRVAQCVAEDKTAWPPTYAEFLGLCQPPAPAPEHRVFERLALEDKTAREKRRQLGMEKCGELLKIFD